MAYTIGDIVTCTATFKNPAANDELVDPTTITCKIKTPAGTTTTYTYGTNTELQRESEGIYTIDVNINAAGAWRYRFASTGSYQAAQEDHFQVHTTNF